MPQVRTRTQGGRQGSSAQRQELGNRGINPLESLTARATGDRDDREHGRGRKAAEQKPDTGLLFVRYLSFIKHR